MSPITLHVRIDAPRERVFQAFSDFPNAAKMVEGIDRVEMLTEGPARKGTRFKETRTMMKRQATEEFEVVEFEPPALLSLRCGSCGMEYVARQRFSPDGAGTRVDFVMTSKARTLGAKIMSPVIGLMMKGMMTKAMQGDLDQIKAYIETGAKA